MIQINNNNNFQVNYLINLYKFPSKIQFQQSIQNKIMNYHNEIYNINSKEIINYNNNNTPNKKCLIHQPIMNNSRTIALQIKIFLYNNK
jgi:hypothetical protein